MTDRNRRMIWIGVFLAAATALFVVSSERALADEPAAALAAAGPTTASDWPQWRGPTRDGIVHGGPKLLNAWPKEGPPLLWKSGTIPGTYSTGGSGSIVVAGGRAFVFVHTKAVVKLIDTKDLNDLGWDESVPDDLGMKLDKDWWTNRDKWPRLKPEEWDAYVKEYMSKLDPDLVKKCGSAIHKRMHQLKQFGAISSWAGLIKLAAVRGKKFSTLEELDGMLGGALCAGHGGPLTAAANPLVRARCFGYTDVVICLDAATGKEIWRKDFPGQWTTVTSDHGHYFSGWAASSTPAIWDDKCYVTGSAGIYCLAVKDGAEIWQAKQGKTSASPLVANGAVFSIDGGINGEGSLVAYNAKDGKLLWRQPKVNFTFSSPVIWTCSGKNYVISCAYNGIFCLDPDNGTIVWKANRGWGQGAYSTPAISGDVLVVNDHLSAYKLTPAKLELLWENKNVHDHSGSVCVCQEHVYRSGGAYNGGACCVSLITGEEKWRAVPGAGDTSPVVADGKVFFMVDGKQAGMFKVLPESYKELGRFNPNMATCTSPAIADGKLFLRLKDGVACYDIAEHKPYLDSAKVVRDELVFGFKQAEGGLAATSGAIEGLALTDATGKTGPAKAHLQGASSLAVDLKEAVFPIKVSYAASGNLSVPNGPLAAFEWSSPRLIFEHCETNTIVLTFERYASLLEARKTEKDYTVAGAKVTGVGVSGGELRLATDKTWKTGEKLTVRYPALSQAQEVSDRTAELSCTVTPGHPVGKQPLDEYLIGEKREKIDPKTIFEHDDLDKNIKPVAGEKWKLVTQTSNAASSAGPFVFSLNALKRQDENALGHACVYVHAETDCKVQLGVNIYGTGAQVIVNGKPVCTDPKWGWNKKEIKAVELKQGWNTLLLGVTPGNWWHFSLCIQNEQGDGAPLGLRYTAEAPVEK